MNALECTMADPMAQHPDSNCSEAGDCRLCANRSEEAWLHGMLRSAFFTPCERHSSLKKHEVTHFCIDCCARSCTHCLTDHTGHRLLQVRRYVYTNVVRASDMSPLLDISGVQTYIINQAKVMFLNQRPQSKMSRPGAPDACATCSRTLREGCSFCSLACKVDALVAAGKLVLPASTTSTVAAEPAACAAQPAVQQQAAPEPAAGSASDSSDCWGAALSCKEALCDTHGSGDSSSSHQLRACSWGDAAQQHQQHQRVGSHAAAWERRHSDTDSDGRCSSGGGGYCCRRKQGSPRRSPLL